MKKIIYYISDHGFGHASRTVAIVRHLLNEEVEIIIRNSNAITFLQKSLPNTKIISGRTDVGTIVKEDGLTIDESKSKNEISKWIDSLEQTSENEIKKIQSLKPNVIISDISPMPFLVSKKLQIPSIAISNFSWFDSHNFLSDEYKSILKHAYDFADLTLQLPLGTKMEHFKKKNKVGFASRIPTKSRIDIRKELGIKNDFLVLYAMGSNKTSINCDNGPEVSIISLHSNVVANHHVIDLPNYVEGENLVAASDLVICKCGYSILSECITNGIPFFYVSDDNRLELQQISLELNKRGIYNQKVFSQINNMRLNNEFFNSLPQITQEPNDNENISNLIMEFVKK